MATLSLRISIPENNATKMMQFDPNTSVYDACRIIKEKIAESNNIDSCKIFTVVILLRLFYYQLLKCQKM